MGVVNFPSFGFAGKLGHRLRIRGEPELASDREPRLETLLMVLVIVEEAELNSDLAGKVVKEMLRVGEGGEVECKA